MARLKQVKSTGWQRGWDTLYRSQPAATPTSGAFLASPKQCSYDLPFPCLLLAWGSCFNLRRVQSSSRNGNGRNFTVRKQGACVAIPATSQFTVRVERKLFHSYSVG